MHTKRFIAGAICPQCHCIDKLVLERSMQTQTIECVNCHYTATQVFSKPSNETNETKEQ